MIIVKLQGGLGNQLYEYALYEKLKTLGRKVLLDDIDYTDRAFLRDIREIELGKFKGLDLKYCSLRQHYAMADDKRTVPARLRRKLFGSHGKVVRETAEYMPEIFEKDNVYLDGFWQCQKYYEDILPMLRAKLFFGAECNADCKLMLKRIKEDPYSTSVHIRLGDYVAKASTYGGIATIDYYRSAIQYIKSKGKEVSLYLFSDDLKGAGRILNEYGISYTPVECNSGDDSIYDMMLMANCRNNICANSSFSIWGATLNGYEDKMSVRPLKSNNDSNAYPELMKELWMGWTIIDEKGLVV